jgi:hypothetical protein
LLTRIVRPDRNSNVLDAVTTDTSTGLRTHVEYVRDVRGMVFEQTAPHGMSRTHDYDLAAVDVDRVAHPVPPGDVVAQVETVVVAFAAPVSQAEQDRYHTRIQLLTH